MQCHSCGTEVREGQKFCMECGASLRGVADITGEVPIVSNRPLSADARDEVTRALGDLQPPGPRPRAGQRDWRHDPHATVQLPSQIRVSADDRTVPLGRPAETNATAVLPATVPRPAAVTAPQRAQPGAREYDYDDRVPDPRPQHAFRLRTLFVLAVLAAAATAVAVLTDLITIDPGGATAPFPVGSWTVNDLGTNNAIAGLVAAGAMVAGALLWSFGLRWGAGLAGGAGAALTGWAALVLGLAEYPLHVARGQAATVPAELTRDVGTYALAVAGVLGVAALVISFAAVRRDRGGLDPWIAALGAASVVVAAAGPLIPLGNVEIDGNWSETALGIDVPQLYLVGRLVQIGLLLVVGVLGFLLVRRFGLGMAVGSALAVGWLCVTAATRQTANPIGPAFANPGATPVLHDGTNVFEPHGVTIVGLGLVGFFALVAITLAIIDHDR